MAQIWLTDSEISALFELSLGAARDQATSANWPRRLSTDGHTRYKISDGAAHLFMIRYARLFFEGEGSQDAAEQAMGAFSPQEPDDEDEVSLDVEAGEDVKPPQPDVSGNGPIEVHVANGAKVSGGTADCEVPPARPQQPDAEYWESVFRRAFEKPSVRS